LFRKLWKEEVGYSLVEVVVSMLLLSIAIIPMVGMFDMGLKTATTGSHYDQARTLANASLEKVQSLPYADARVTYKPVNASPTAGTPVSCGSGIFTCNVTTTYVNDSLIASSAATTKMKVVVTVTWDGRSYTTTGLKAQ
jgi:Tfp pilus assembly protein PilV